MVFCHSSSLNRLKQATFHGWRRELQIWKGAKTKLSPELLSRIKHVGVNSWISICIDEYRNKYRHKWRYISSCGPCPLRGSRSNTSNSNLAINENICSQETSWIFTSLCSFMYNPTVPYTKTSSSCSSYKNSTEIKTGNVKHHVPLHQILAQMACFLWSILWNMQAELTSPTSAHGRIPILSRNISSSFSVLVIALYRPVSAQYCEFLWAGSDSVFLCPSCP